MSAHNAGESFAMKSSEDNRFMYSFYSSCKLVHQHSRKCTGNFSKDGHTVLRDLELIILSVDFYGHSIKNKLNTIFFCKILVLRLKPANLVCKGHFHIDRQEMKISRPAVFTQSPFYINYLDKKLFVFESFQDYWLKRPSSARK